MKVARGSLVWRLYLVGLGQLALVAALAFGSSWLTSRLSRHWETRDLPSALQSFVGDGHREELAARLVELARARDLELTVYGDDRQVFATSVTPPLSLPHFGEHGDGPPPPGPPPPGAPPGPPPDGFDDRGPPPGPLPPDAPPRLADPARPPHVPHVHNGPTSGSTPPNQYAPVEHDGRIFLLVTRFVPGARFTWGELFTLLAGLLVVGAGAVGTVRWISLPLARLTRAAQALGEGDLRVRADLGRRDELGELGAAFDEMAGRMQRLLTAERELLANVSHELRTPLARIKVALELADEGDADAARAAISEIAVDLAELERLVEDVLQATRLTLEDGRAPMSGFALRPQETTAEQLAEESAQRFVAHHPARKLNVKLPKAPPAPLFVDPQLVRRVLGNLLENAHKYTPDADVPIDLVVEAAHDAVSFAVVDRGIGIPTAELPRVFDAFFRTERSRSRGTGGVGLGLTLAKRIVDAHAGTLEVGRGIAGGTRVVVTLPTAMAPPGPPPSN